MSTSLPRSESADTGEEATPPFGVAPDGEVIRFLTGEQEQHISADVAFGVWNYWQATGDDRFLVELGAEILIEITAVYAKDSHRSSLEGRSGYKDFAAFVTKYISPAQLSDPAVVYGFIAATIMTHVLKQCGDDLSRENILRQADPLSQQENAQSGTTMAGQCRLGDPLCGVL